MPCLCSDIKPENIMAHTLSGRQPIIKLVDFGLATTITHPLRLVCGSPSYVAPEVVLKSKEGFVYLLLLLLIQQ